MVARSRGAPWSDAEAMVEAMAPSDGDKARMNAEDIVVGASGLKVIRVASERTTSEASGE